jgi:hypothetical protein
MTRRHRVILNECCLPHGDPPSFDPLQWLLDRLSGALSQFRQSWQDMRKGAEAARQSAADLSSDVWNWFIDHMW